MEQDLPSSLIFHNRYFNLRNAKYIVKTLIIFYGTNTGAKLQPIYNFLAWTSFIEGDSGALNKACPSIPICPLNTCKWTGGAKERKRTCLSEATCTFTFFCGALTRTSKS